MSDDTQVLKQEPEICTVLNTSVTVDDVQIRIICWDKFEKITIYIPNRIDITVMPQSTTEASRKWLAPYPESEWSTRDPLYEKIAHATVKLMSKNLLTRPIPEQRVIINKLRAELPMFRNLAPEAAEHLGSDIGDIVHGYTVGDYTVGDSSDIEFVIEKEEAEKEENSYRINYKYDGKELNIHYYRYSELHEYVICTIHIPAATSFKKLLYINGTFNRQISRDRPPVVEGDGVRMFFKIDNATDKDYQIAKLAILKILTVPGVNELLKQKLTDELSKHHGVHQNFTFGGAGKKKIAITVVLLLVIAVLLLTCTGDGTIHAVVQIAAGVLSWIIISGMNK